MNEAAKKTAMVSSNFGPINDSNDQEVGFKLGWVEQIINFFMFFILKNPKISALAKPPV